MGKEWKPEFFRTLFFFLFAASAAVQDARERSISIRTFQSFALGGAVLWVWSFQTGMSGSAAEHVLGLLLAFLPGTFLCLLSIVSSEAIGKGDAFYFLTAAFYVSATELWILLCAGLMLSSLAGLILFAGGGAHTSGRIAGKEGLPFAVFLFPAVCLKLFLGMG